MNSAKLPVLIIVLIGIFHLGAGKCCDGLIVTSFFCENTSFINIHVRAELQTKSSLFRSCNDLRRSAEKYQYLTIQGTNYMFGHLITSDLHHFIDYIIKAAF